MKYKSIFLTCILTFLVQLSFGDSLVKLTEFSHDYKTHANNLSCNTYVVPGYGPWFHHDKLVSLKIHKIGYYYHPSIFKINKVYKNTMLIEDTKKPFLSCQNIEDLKQMNSDEIFDVQSKLSTFLRMHYIKSMDICESSIVERLKVTIEEELELTASAERSTGRTPGNCKE
ncbi:hypothetical protein N9N67_11730 [Bacteriovoracaceae bacterium]|nr:hypothetical protein [Bacteriovoracaceae bacterium]